MSSDWSWTIREAVERLKSRYEYIGRKTGAPFLALIYPPEVEAAFLKECKTQFGALGPEYDVRYVDVLECTMAVVDELGGDNIVGAIAEPMPGSSPETELGIMWINSLVHTVKERAKQNGDEKGVVVLERLAALYPATGPRALMQSMWDSEQSSLDCPVVVLIPGTLVESRVYSYLNQRVEFMYRGDIL